MGDGVHDPVEDEPPQTPSEQSPERCPECGGTGEREGRECPACDGTGHVMRGLGGG